jgi:hypothetical protein
MILQEVVDFDMTVSFWHESYNEPFARIKCDYLHDYGDKVELYYFKYMTDSMEEGDLIAVISNFHKWEIQSENT